MGSLFKKTATKPLPAGAKIIVRKGQRLAEWIDAKGKRRAAPITVGRDGADRIVITARTYTAKYRDGNNHVREVATGCRDESAARSVLGKLERRAELVKGEVLSAAEDAVIDHQATPLADHIAAFIDHQKAKGLSRRVTGTDDSIAFRFAPGFAPTTGKPCTLQAIVDKVVGEAKRLRATDAVAASACVVNRKDPLTIAVNGSCE